MNNKKKILVILIAVFLCSGMFFISEMVKYSSSSKTAQKSESEVKDLSTEANNNEKSSDDNKGTNKETTNDSTKNDTTSTQQDSDKSTENKTEATQQATTTQEPKQQGQRLPKGSKVIVQNGITGSTILSINISADNKSVGEATTSALDSKGVDYKATGFGPTMYIASIAGLSEKAEGPTSGWTYYVQKGGSGSFVKPGVSCGSYKLQDGDVVLWKYVKEGV